MRVLGVGVLQGYDAVVVVVVVVVVVATVVPPNWCRHQNRRWAVVAFLVVVDVEVVAAATIASPGIPSERNSLCKDKQTHPSWIAEERERETRKEGRNRCNDKRASPLETIFICYIDVKYVY